MKSAEKTITPAHVGIMALCAGGTALVALLFMPALELVQAQVDPAARRSGESPVRLLPLMQFYAGLGAQTLPALSGVRQPVPLKVEERGNPNPPQIVLPKDYTAWQDHVAQSLSDKSAAANAQKKDVAGKEYVAEMQKSVGDSQLKQLVDMYLNDPNYPYYAYGLFLGIAMLLSAIAINAIGRVEAEEITVIPVKK